jgi:hypothetical protein
MRGQRVEERRIIKIQFRCKVCQSAFDVDEAMAGKKFDCPDCREKLQVPQESDEVSAFDFNPRMRDMSEWIESIDSLEFCKEALCSMVAHFSSTVNAYRNLCQDKWHREQADLKRQAESWENEAVLIELREQFRVLERENAALKQGGAIPVDGEYRDPVLEDSRMA